MQEQAGKAHKNLSKLTKIVIISMNGHRMAVYVKLGLPMMKGKKVKKEPWGSSDKKVQELTISMFGTAEEVMEMAIMPKVERLKRPFPFHRYWQLNQIPAPVFLGSHGDAKRYKIIPCVFPLAHEETGH